MLELVEACRGDELSPRFERVKRSVAFTSEALAVGPMGIRTEEHAARQKRLAQLTQHAHNFLRRHVKQRRVGEHAVKVLPRQRELQEVLLKHLAARCVTRHGDEFRRAVESDCFVTQSPKVCEISARAAAEIEHAKRRRALDRAEQGEDVLRHIVVTRALAEAACCSVVVRDGAGGERAQFGF